jgi:hypothetical protein
VETVDLLTQRAADAKAAAIGEVTDPRMQQFLAAIQVGWQTRMGHTQISLWIEAADHEWHWFPTDPEMEALLHSGVQFAAAKIVAWVAGVLNEPGLTEADTPYNPEWGNAEQRFKPKLGDRCRYVVNAPTPEMRCLSYWQGRRHPDDPVPNYPAHILAKYATDSA